MRLQAETLTPEHAAALLRRQDRLQTEADALLARLDLLRHLRRVGRPEQIGSSVLGLMVWRDIDVNVVSPGLRAARAFEAMSPLITDPRATQVRAMRPRARRPPGAASRRRRAWRSCSSSLQ